MMKEDNMVKHYIIRDKLYKEENRLEVGISQQVCIDLSCYSKIPMNIYSAHREGKILVQYDIISENKRMKKYVKLIVYVKDEKLALKLADRGINETTQKEKDYKIVGIDKYYSVFG